MAKKFRTDPTDPLHMELAFKAAEFRKEMDALLVRHNCRFGLGWGDNEDKNHRQEAYLQLHFLDDPLKHAAVTILSVRKGRKLKYLIEVEEDEQDRHP